MYIYDSIEQFAQDRFEQYLLSRYLQSSIIFDSGSIVLKEIFISYSKNVEIGSKDKDSK